MTAGVTEAALSPRIVVAGLSGDAGKTLVSLGLTLAMRARGLDVRVFKKGPDYIDAAWLAWAAGRPARNLDTWMAGFEEVRRSFARHAKAGGLNLIEGNRGLFDGIHAEGTHHSTAELARALDAPVLLVVDARKATRTLAACVLGCQAFDPYLKIGAVILNRVSGGRHETVAREAIEQRCGVPVVGVIPPMEGSVLLPGRHLGLVPPEEHEAADDARKRLLGAAEAHIDLDRVLAIASTAGVAGPERQVPERRVPERQVPGARQGTLASVHSARGRLHEEERESASACAAVIGYLRDSAFSFYYPDNLEALEAAGAKLLPIPSLERAPLPAGLDALYIGGGFPETHAAPLAANRTLLDSLACAARAGLPIYAECGGLMLLARGLRWNGARHEMSGVLTFDVEVGARPHGHGYTTLLVDRENNYFPPGTVLKGHEFHYSRPVDSPESREALQQACCAVERGVGCGAGRDGLVAGNGNVWASYTHLHALATPQWAPAMVNAARRFRAGRTTAV